MGMNLKLSSSPLGTRNVTEGGGQYLLQRDVFSPRFRSAVSARTNDLPASSTAEYYGLDGIYPPTPQDMSQWGAFGASLIASTGYRYACIIGCDHPQSNSGEEGGWGRDSQSIYAGFTNDPAILPDPSTMRRIISNRVVTPPGATGTENSSGFNNCLVYSPEDVTTPIHVYVGSWVTSGIGSVGLSEILFARADFDGEFTSLSMSHPIVDATDQGLVSYQMVYRDSSTNYHSYGGWNENVNDGSQGKWVSTDGGLNFTKTGSAFTATIGSSYFQLTGGGYVVDISGQDYVPVREQITGGFSYVTLVPFSDTTGALASPSTIRISDRYTNDYPGGGILSAGNGFLQYVGSYEEDGLLFLQAVHNFFADTGLGAGNQNKLPENGGGSNEQYIDLYGYPIPGQEALAATSAPCGVKASCSAGVVTISWYDLPAGRTYRVYRGTTVGTQATLIGDVTGTSTTNSPTPGSVYYYKVVSLDAGVEQQSRVVSTYVG
jgi:hypothetical protein